MSRQSRGAAGMPEGRGGPQRARGDRPQGEAAGSWAARGVDDARRDDGSAAYSFAAVRGASTPSMREEKGRSAAWNAAAPPYRQHERPAAAEGVMRREMGPREGERYAYSTPRRVDYAHDEHAAYARSYSRGEGRPYARSSDGARPYDRPAPPHGAYWVDDSYPDTRDPYAYERRYGDGYGDAYARDALVPEARFERDAERAGRYAYPQRQYYRGPGSSDHRDDKRYYDSQRKRGGGYREYDGDGDDDTFTPRARRRLDEDSRYQSQYEREHGSFAHGARRYYDNRSRYEPYAEEAAPYRPPQPSARGASHEAYARSQTPPQATPYRHSSARRPASEDPAARSTAPRSQSRSRSREPVRRADADAGSQRFKHHLFDDDYNGEDGSSARGNGNEAMRGHEQAERQHATHTARPSKAQIRALGFSPGDETVSDRDGAQNVARVSSSAGPAAEGAGQRRDERNQEPKQESTQEAPPAAVDNAGTNASAYTKLAASRAVVAKSLNASQYHREAQVGEGTYGKVYKATNTLTGSVVALKRIKIENDREGFPFTAMREIKLLQSLRHPQIISLLEMMVEKNHMFMVLDYMDHDITGILANKQFRFEEAHIKDLTVQLFDALAFLHHRGVLHRDIKGSNILLNNAGELKLADFGLARFYDKHHRQSNYTNRVITLWYRPPELLLGATAYGPSADVWSAGCIVVELFTRKALFPGHDEVHELEQIFSVLGSPDEKQWPEVLELPWYALVRPKSNMPDRLGQILSGSMSDAALDFIRGILQYNPKLRPRAAEIANHPYIQADPQPQRCTTLRDIEGEWHEYESKRRREK